MSVSSINQSDIYALIRQRQVDLKATADADAVPSAAKDLPALSNLSASSTTDDTPPWSSIASKIKADLSAVISNLKSGDTTNAKSALNVYLEDMSSFGTSADSASQATPSLEANAGSSISSVQSTDTPSDAGDPMAVLQELLQGGSGPQGAHGHHHHHHGGPPPADTQNNATNSTNSVAPATTTDVASTDDTDPLSQILDELAQSVKKQAQVPTSAAA